MTSTRRSGPRRRCQRGRPAPPEERAAFCTAIAEKLAELAEIITRELGMPLASSRAIQVGGPIRTFTSMDSVIKEIAFEEEVGTSLTIQEPIGVVGAITPWNYPLHQIAAKVAPAITSGCTVVLKPSEVTPLDAFVLSDIMEAVGLPPGTPRPPTGTPPAPLLSATRAAADIVRPSMHWLLAGGAANDHFTRALAAERDPAGFARLQGLLDADPELSATARRVTVHRAAVIVAAKGGTLGEVTIGDLLAEYAAEDEALRSPCQGMQVIYGALRAMGVIDGPASFRQLRAAGPRTPGQMIDRYHLACQPVRDLLVDYLRERQPALDHSTLQHLGYELGKLFWADIEQHHPGIAGIHLPDDVARAWKQRLQVKDGSGGAAQAGTERISARHCLTAVRAFYLDVAQWALDDPSRWARWAVPCPVRPQEISSRKAAQHRKSRMDARTRERLPVLPALASALD
nr:aldehyde dehydrogenase family protein [Actinomycetota bacterium]